MIGKCYEIRTQVVFDHLSAFRSVSRTETRRRSPKTSPFDGPERQQAVEMIERMAGGDEAALAAFYERFAPLLYGLALKMMKDEKDAEDVVQEGFVYIWRKAAAYNPQMISPFSWAVMVVRNKAIDRIRSRLRVARIVERATAEFSHSAEADERSANEPLFSEQRALVRTALAQIPEEQRQAIELAFFSGLTHEEIAAHLTTPLGTIKARIRRGMIHMRELLVEER
jgi:RNA polymerase sigma-70 factor (ECF subfamily)